MKRAGIRASLFSIAIASAALSVLSGCIAPDDAFLMELNRKGKWQEAERVGADMLAHRDTFTHSQISSIYLSVIHARARMGKKSEAVALMTEYDAFSVRGIMDAKYAWLGREMAQLKDELGLLDEVQHTLVSAMNENEKGGFARAREICDSVLAIKEATDIQKATAHFVAAVCSIRLKDVETAEIHLAAFDTLKSALPSDHQALREEPAARQGLRELKQQRKE
jgi:hypothetical protein